MVVPERIADLSRPVRRSRARARPETREVPSRTSFINAPSVNTDGTYGTDGTYVELISPMCPISLIRDMPLTHRARARGRRTGQDKADTSLPGIKSEFTNTDQKLLVPA
jgi:hypothetical protein